MALAGFQFNLADDLHNTKQALQQATIDLCQLQNKHVSLRQAEIQAKIDLTQRQQQHAVAKQIQKINKQEEF